IEMNNLFLFLLDLSRYLLLLCLASSFLVGFIHFKKLSNAFKVLTVYVLVTFVLELLAFWLAENNLNNFFTMHLFTLLELIFFALFFKPYLKKPRLFARYYDVIIAGFLGIIVCFSLFVQPIQLMNVYSETLENIILMFLSILFFSTLYLSEDALEDRFRRPLVLVNSGLLLYLSGSLLIFMFGEYILLHSLNMQWIIWMINVILNMIFKVLVLVALIQVARLSKASPSNALN
ncbi:MAG: hypothetical protein AAGD05_14125, partial [Bacteroidota bacterium]